MDKDKKIKPSLSDALVLHYAAWCIIAIMMTIILFRNSDMLKLYFGNSIISIFIISAIWCAASPLYLLLVKSKRIRHIIMHAFTLTFFICFLALRIGAGFYIRDFTTEKWMEYSSYRHKMMDDLIKNHGIIGMNQAEVTMLLGEPDSKNSSIFSYYIDREDRAFKYIEVVFNEGMVKAVNFIYNI